MTSAPVLARGEPVIEGPTWQRDASGRFILPAYNRTLGWQILGWTHEYLRFPDGTAWKFTPEQARHLLWWYAVDDHGRFVYRRGVLRRMKGHGKDPYGACLAAIEFVGPCRFDHWDDDGQPVAASNPVAWVQIAAVAFEQTKNTMTLFASLFSPEAISTHGIDIGKEKIYADGGRRRIEAITSSARTNEGNRPTFVIENETEHWLASNGGHAMAAVMARNLAKSPHGAARAIQLANAHEPGEDSIAERSYEAWLKIKAGASRARGLMYDSIEAPADTVLADERSLRYGLRVARGDSRWVNVRRLIDEIYDPETKPSESRRFYLNQIVAAEDAWTTPQEWAVNGDKDLTLEPGQAIALFFDGSKSDDTTGLVACRISDGAVFVLGSWARPQLQAEKWTVPRDQVDDRVQHARGQYDVVGFFGDPGTGDDEDESGARYWDALLDKWGREMGDTLCVWASTFGQNRHAVLWDMRDQAHQKDFTAAVERALDDIISKDFPHNGDVRLAQHVANARRWPNRYGVTIGKESRSSTKKIDLAVCAIGARMVRRIYLALPDNKKRQPKSHPRAFVFGADGKPIERTKEPQL